MEILRSNFGRDRIFWTKITYLRFIFIFYTPSSSNLNYVWFQTLSDLVTEKDLDSGSLYPPTTTIKDCSLKIAAKLVEQAFADGKLIFFFKQFLLKKDHL